MGLMVYRLLRIGLFLPLISKLEMCHPALLAMSFSACQTGVKAPQQAKSPRSGGLCALRVLGTCRRVGKLPRHPEGVRGVCGALRGA